MRSIKMPAVGVMERRWKACRGGGQEEGERAAEGPSCQGNSPASALSCVDLLTSAGFC